MYIPAAFREEDPTALHQLMARNPFATLVTGAGPGLCASHVPVLLEPGEGACGTLRGHLARANEQWRVLETGAEALVIFQGPHAYVSPSWYEAELAVPTWNYAVVHAYGIPRLITDEERFPEMLEDLVRTFEASRPEPWSTNGLPEDWVRRLMGGIVGFAVEITRLEGKFKLGQNRSLGDQQRVASELSKSAEPVERDLAELQLQRMER